MNELKIRKLIWYGTSADNVSLRAETPMGDIDIIGTKENMMIIFPKCWKHSRSYINCESVENAKNIAEHRYRKTVEDCIQFLDVSKI